MSDCGVCIGNNGDTGDGYDFDCGPHVMAEDTKCCECYRIIPAGESFESAHWMSDDDGEQQAHTCAVCAEIAWAFSCQARIYWNLWEDMQDCVFPDFSQACLEKLVTPNAKAELQRRWMKWKGLPA